MTDNCYLSSHSSLLTTPIYSHITHLVHHNYFYVNPLSWAALEPQSRWNLLSWFFLGNIEYWFPLVFFSVWTQMYPPVCPIRAKDLLYYFTQNQWVKEEMDSYLFQVYHCQHKLVGIRTLFSSVKHYATCFSTKHCLTRLKSRINSWYKRKNSIYINYKLYKRCSDNDSYLFQ